MKKKMNLADIKVQSFVTTQTVRGGGDTNQDTWVLPCVPPDSDYMCNTGICMLTTHLNTMEVCATMTEC